MYPVFSPDGSDVILRINDHLDGQAHSVLFLAHLDEAGGWSEAQPVASPINDLNLNGGLTIAADIYWMKADFLLVRVTAMKAKYGIVD